MKIPAKIRQLFESDLNRALVSKNPEQRTKTIVTLFVALTRDKLRTAWGGPAEVAIRAELERTAEEVRAE